MKNAFETQLALNLRYLRRLFRYTQDDVAEAIHICRSAYALYETGRKIPHTDTILLLADFYGIHPGILLEPLADWLPPLVLCKDAGREAFYHLLEIFTRLSDSRKLQLLARAEQLMEQETGRP